MTNIVGLTGIIGSGKSFVASVFEDLGVPYIDTDLIAHQITTKNGIAIPKIRDAFGDEYISSDGALERKKMRDLVFDEPDRRVVLEGILHPLIFDKVIQCIKDINTVYLILMVPLLFKSSKYRDLVDRIIFVDCPEEILIARIVQRNKLDVAQIKKIIATHVSREQQLRMSDDIIDNSGDRKLVISQVHQLHTKYMQLFSK